MKTLAYICFAVGIFGVWTIFHGYPPYGCVMYIAGTVFGVVFYQRRSNREEILVADVVPVSSHSIGLTK
jgi:hypothetical protein